MNLQFKRALVGISAVALVAAAASQGTAAVSGASDQVTPQQKKTLQAGIQLAPKSTKAPTATVNGKEVARPNPYLANTPDATATDWSYWHNLMDAKGKQRAKSAGLAAAKTKAAGKALPSPILHDEEEPDAISGSNDSQASAERVAGFGTGAKENPRLRILGSMPDLTPSQIGIDSGSRGRRRDSAGDRHGDRDGRPAADPRRPARSATVRTGPPGTAPTTSTSTS